jgi:tRNA G18 (ribose-2'-O)-methylase SpoU
MPGNEGTGLSLNQKQYCDDYVFIPQYRATIESLNVSVATSIVLYEAYHAYKKYAASVV